SGRGGTFHQLQQPIHLDGTVLLAGEAVPEVTEPVSNYPAISSSERAVEVAWRFDLVYIVPYFLVLTLIHFLRVVRWGPLLRPLGHVPFAALNRIGAVGNMAVFLLPLRLGEFVRPYMLSKEFPNIRISEGLATIVIERVVDGLMVSLVLFAVLFQIPDTAPSATEIRIGAYLALLCFLGGMVLLVFLYWQRDNAVGAIDATLRKISTKLADKFSKLLKSFLRGLAVLPQWKSFGLFVVYTAAYWGINAIGLWVFAHGFGLAIPLVAAYAMMSCVVVGMMIPNSPGNVGTFWYFLLLPLAVYGIPSDVPQVMIYGLAVYLMQLVQQSLFGIYFLVTKKVSTQSIVDASRAGETLDLEDS
ncbi:MAG: flippase-like domain-containing protein, partial [Myxococcales bacterium]|nr:flippase-like domain-containing protein [Myxococcales bacterium]